MCTTRGACAIVRSQEMVLKISVFPLHFQRLALRSNFVRRVSTSPSRQVTEIDESQAAPLLQADQLPTSQPFVIRGHVNSWPALSSWPRAEYWSPHRDLTVPVEVCPRGGQAEEAEGRHIGPAQVSSYLRPEHTVSHIPLGMIMDYVLSASRTERASLPYLYLAQYNLHARLQGLDKDTPLPSVLQALKHAYRLNVWIGPPDIVTPPHRDPYYNLYSLVHGRKYVRLWSSTIPGSDMHVSSDPLHANTSTVDDVRRPGPGYESFASLPYQDTELHPGDSLYIPRHWWHYVEGQGQGLGQGQGAMAVSMWWDPPMYKPEGARAESAGDKHELPKSAKPLPPLSRKDRVRPVPR